MFWASLTKSNQCPALVGVAALLHDRLIGDRNVAAATQFPRPGCKDAYRRNFWFTRRRNATAKLREGSFNAAEHPCTAVPVSEVSIHRDLIADDHQDNPDCDCHVGQYAAA
jgi:hypothetical protein